MKNVLILLLALLAFTCSKKVVLKVQKPAQYNVSDIKRIAVFDFEGPKKSGEIIKKHTGMRTTLKRMASQSICLKLDDNFFRHRWISVAMISRKVLFKKIESSIGKK